MRKPWSFLAKMLQSSRVWDTWESLKAFCEERLYLFGPLIPGSPRAKNRHNRRSKLRLSLTVESLEPRLVPSTVALWTFENSTPSGSGASSATYSPEFGSGQASSAHASSSTVYTSTTGDGTSHSFSSNHWAAGDYYQFMVDLSSYSGNADVVVSAEVNASAPGPKDLKLQYSADGSTFTDADTFSVATSSGTPIAWNPSTYNPASLVEFNLGQSVSSGLLGQSTVYFRFTVADSTSLNGGTIGAGPGRLMVDDVTIATTDAPTVTGVSPATGSTAGGTRGRH